MRDRANLALTSLNMRRLRQDVEPADVKLEPAKNQEKPILFVCPHKAGSSVANELLPNASRLVGRRTLDLASEGHALGVEPETYCIARSHVLGKPGYYFGAFRGLEVVSFEKLDRCRLIIQVRDPRDVLVSYYYSLGWTHKLPGEGDLRDHVLQAREYIPTHTIDEFVSRKIGWANTRYSVLNYLLKHHDDCLLLKYEEMLLDWPRWIGKLRDFLGYPLNPYQWEFLREGVGLNLQSGEGPFAKHKRKMLPHDFVNQLKPRTQRRLNRALRLNLQRFGYPYQVTESTIREMEERAAKARKYFRAMREELERLKAEAAAKEQAGSSAT